jgi:hypothetical protein
MQGKRDSDGSLRLETIGGLEDEPRAGTDRIFGQCLGTPVTLVDARWNRAQGAVNRSGEADPDATSEQWTATIGLLGKHTSHDQAFDSVRIESYWIDGWTDIEYWKTDFRNGVLLRFANDRNTLQSTSFSDGTIVLAVGMSSTTGQRSWSVSRQTTVEVQRNNAMSLDNCIADVGHLDALTTILFGRPTSATHISVQPGGQHHLSGASRQLIGVIAPGRYAEPERRIHPPSDSLCTFEQSGELNGLANWFSLHEDFRYLAGRVASHHRAEGRFIEDRALTAFSAGEALDRTATGYSQSSARTRWKRLANAVPEFVTEYLDLPVDAWAHALVERRNDLSHALSLGHAARRHGGTLKA